MAEGEMGRALDCVTETKWDRSDAFSTDENLKLRKERRGLEVEREII
jgi:hypothetical protein